MPDVQSWICVSRLWSSVSAAVMTSRGLEREKLWILSSLWNSVFKLQKPILRKLVGSLQAPTKLEVKFLMWTSGFRPEWCFWTLSSLHAVSWRPDSFLLSFQITKNTTLYCAKHSYISISRLPQLMDVRQHQRVASSRRPGCDKWVCEPRYVLMMILKTVKHVMSTVSDVWGNRLL